MFLVACCEDISVYVSSIFLVVLMIVMRTSMSVYKVYSTYLDLVFLVPVSSSEKVNIIFCNKFNYVISSE